MSWKHFKRLVSRQYEKKLRFTGYVYNFSVDYETIAVDDIKNIHIHNYLMEKNNIV